MDELDKILHKLNPLTINGQLTSAHQEAKTALYDLIAKEVIGEDVIPNMHKGLLQSNQDAQNRLKKRQRQTLKKLFGVKE